MLSTRRAEPHVLARTPVTLARRRGCRGQLASHSPTVTNHFCLGTEQMIICSNATVFGICWSTTRLPYKGVRRSLGHYKDKETPHCPDALLGALWPRPARHLMAFPAKHHSKEAILNIQMRSRGADQNTALRLQLWESAGEKEPARKHSL